jgi:integrase
VEAPYVHEQRQLEEREKLGSPWRDYGLVFCTQVGTPLNRNNVHARSFKPLVERAGLPPTLRFHDLRHSFATLMLKGGEHPKVVQEMMGHANINITLDTYSHVLPDMQNEAANRLGDLLSKLPTAATLLPESPRQLSGALLHLCIFPANTYKTEVARPGIEPGTP